jgi:hypothetical protein
LRSLAPSPRALYRHVVAARSSSPTLGAFDDVVSADKKGDARQLKIRFGRWFSWKVSVNESHGTAGGSMKMRFPVEVVPRDRGRLRARCTRCFTDHVVRHSRVLRLLRIAPRTSVVANARLQQAIEPLRQRVGRAFTNRGD